MVDMAQGPYARRARAASVGAQKRRSGMEILAKKTHTWRALEDPDNPENHNAGNGGDLVKHTVYLTLLRFLREREPWQSGMVVRECHAGRGIYRLDGKRAALVERLLRHDALALARAQCSALDALDARAGWYAGSALLSARETDRYEGFEWDPATRRILAAVLASSRAVVPHAGEPDPFDGESYVAEHIGGWSERDVVLLDPFGLWLHDKHAFRRARYRRILSTWCLGDRAPVVALFWTWGRALDAAAHDLDGSAPGPEDGYRALAELLHGRERVVVRWRWELAYAMWLLCPEALCAELREALARECGALFDALAPPGAELSVSLTR
jgi:hypothetical protein